MRIHVVHPDGENATYDVEEILIPYHEGPLLFEPGHLSVFLKITPSAEVVDSTCVEVSDD